MLWVILWVYFGAFVMCLDFVLLYFTIFVIFCYFIVILCYFCYFVKITKNNVLFCCYFMFFYCYFDVIFCYFVVIFCYFVCSYRLTQFQVILILDIA